MAAALASGALALRPDPSCDMSQIAVVPSGCTLKQASSKHVLCDRTIGPGETTAPENNLGGLMSSLQVVASADAR